MTRQRRFTAPGTAFLLFLISACGADGTGPEDEPEVEVVMDRIAVNIGHIEVIHDCDPAWDNPGDFQGFVGIWQATDPTQAAYQLVGSSPWRSMLLNSGESASGDHIRAEALVSRVQALPVRVQGVFHELDHGEVDAAAELDVHINWDDGRNCWQIGGACLPRVGADEFHRTWTHHVHTRDDVWNPFNSDDEGCEFRVTFVANIGGS